MKKVNVKLDFVLMSIFQFIDFCLNVIKCMDSNPEFPSPDVPLSEIETSVDKLRSKHALALTGNKAAKEGTELARKDTEKLLKLNAHYVDRIADGNEEIIANSGYHATKQPRPAVRPVFNVTAGSEDGSIILTCKAVEKARSYAWQYVPNPLPEDEKLWVYAGISTQTKCVVQNLESGSKFWFRVAAITPLGQLPWCEPIMKVVP